MSKWSDMGFTEDQIEKYVALPQTMFGEDRCFIAFADGNGMCLAGIHTGDALFFKPQTTAEDGDVCAVIVDGEMKCRRYLKKGNKIVLRREDNETADTIVDRCEIRGVLVGIYKKYKARAV